MKKTISAISVVLSLLMILSLLPVTAYDSPENGVTVIAIDEPGTDNTIKIEPAASASVDWDGVFATVSAAIEAREPSADISACNVPYTDADSSTIQNLFVRTPAYFRSYRFASFSIRNNKITDINIEYNTGNFGLEESEYARRLGVCEDALESILFGVRDNDNLSDAEKMLIVHDRIAVGAEYDYAGYLNGVVPYKSYTAYGVLGERVGVCEGYSMANGWALDILGIENYYNSSAQINHGWNLVYLDGEAYQTDVTWDDPVEDSPGYVRHINFLVSTDTFAETGEHRKSDGSGGWLPLDYDTSAVSTAYENKWWSGLETEVQLIGGVLYYLGTDMVLYRVNGDGESEALFALPTRWHIPGSSSSYTNKYSKIASIGDEILYTCEDGVRSYNVATAEDKLVFVPERNETNAGLYSTLLSARDGMVSVGLTEQIYDRVPAETQTFAYCDHENTILLAGEEPTCTSGSTAKYICADCRYVFTKTSEASDHNYVLRKVVTSEATCAAYETGYYTMTCTECGDEIRGESYTGTELADHTPREAVRENVIDATCKDYAGYDMVTYCIVCSGELSRVHVTDTEAGYGAHTPAQPVRENETAAACETAGSYDEVICCTVCLQELSRRTVITEKTGHKWDKGSVTSEPTCAQPGEKTFACLVCSATRTEPVAKLTTHNYGEPRVVKEPSCTEKGAALFVCEDCGFEKTEDIEKTAHKDLNKDNICDDCGKTICGHMCHKDGFMGFIWKIVNLINRILGKNQYCECGIRHY